MFRRFNNFSLLFVPVDSVGAIEDKSLNKEDVITLLGEDDDKEVIDLDKPIKEKEVVEEDKEDKELDKETDELKELEDELEEPTEEDLELVTPVRRREILAKYPKLFKDFPYLEKAYYREQQYTELLPTIDDAKIAIDKSTTLDKFENQLMSGSTEDILKAVKDTDENAFFKIVDSYLPTLAKVDEKAYHHVIGNVIKRTIIEMVNEARANEDNKQLEAAAQLLNQFVFGTSKFANPTVLSKEQPKDTKNNELEEKERQFNQRQFESARDDLSTRVNNILRSTIEAHIDPKDSMTDYVRRNAVREALENVENLVSQDSRFKVLVDKLWNQAFKTNFSKKSLDDIRSAYTSKAKTLLPSVIKKARNEALKGLGKKVKDEETIESEENDSTVSPKLRTSTSSSTNSGRSVKDQAKAIPKGMKTLDFLNS